jgi:hypothetical protein
MGKNRLKIITTSLLITITTALFAQGEKPQNIYRVTVNSRYVIENGERTSKYALPRQL